MRKEEEVWSSKELITLSEDFERKQEEDLSQQILHAEKEYIKKKKKDRKIEKTSSRSSQI